MLSVIIPAYNEDAMLRKTASVISEIMEDASITAEKEILDLVQTYFLHRQENQNYYMKIDLQKL